MELCETSVIEESLKEVFLKVNVSVKVKSWIHRLKYSTESTEIVIVTRQFGNNL